MSAKNISRFSISQHEFDRFTSYSYKIKLLLIMLYVSNIQLLLYSSIKLPSRKVYIIHIFSQKFSRLFLQIRYLDLLLVGLLFLINYTDWIETRNLPVIFNNEYLTHFDGLQTDSVRFLNPSIR